MAASVMTKVFLPLRLTVRTRATSAPAWATRKRPGSMSRRPSKPASACSNGRGVLGHLGRRVEGAAVIVDAQAAAGVDGLEHDAFALELLDQFGDALHGLAKGLRGANLRADVDADAVRLKPAVACRALVDARAPGECRCRTCARAGRWRCRDASRQRRRD